MLEIILTILLFLFIITFIVTIHEFGHYKMAKKFGVQVDEFSVGMGPLVYKKIYKGTQYSIRAFPVGGYVKMLGESESSEKKGSYTTLKPWKKLIIIFAGVVMNIFLAVIVYTILAITSAGTFFGILINDNYTYPIADSHLKKIAVSTVEEDSPAKSAGLKSFDVINKVNNVDYKDYDEFKKVVSENTEKEIPLEIASYLGGPKTTVLVTPRDREKHNLSDKQGAIGFSLVPVYFSRADFNGASLPLAGALFAIDTSSHYFDTLGTIFHAAIEKKDATIVTDSFSSPVGTYAATKKVLDLNGIYGVLTIVALLSLTIAIMNAVPFPSLDGWHGLFIIIEMITKRKVPERLYNIVTLTGFVLLLALGVFITLKDIININQLF